MDYEDLEYRIKKLEIEVKEKLDIETLISYILYGFLTIKIIDWIFK